MEKNKILVYNNCIMKDEILFRQTIAENIALYRKANNLTQFQMADRLNYSDKAISKWERGESLPDIYILSEIADLFGISITDLLEKHKTVVPRSNYLNTKVVTLLSVSLVWLVAVVFCSIFTITLEKNSPAIWLPFIYAIPVSCIVLIVFCRIWYSRLGTFISVSLLYYTIPLAVLLTVGGGYNTWSLFLLAVPLQIMTILWFFRKRQ